MKNPSPLHSLQRSLILAKCGKGKPACRTKSICINKYWMEICPQACYTNLRMQSLIHGSSDDFPLFFLLRFTFAAYKIIVMKYCGNSKIYSNLKPEKWLTEHLRTMLVPYSTILRFTGVSRPITWRASISVSNEKTQKLFAFRDWFWCFSYIKVRFLLRLWIYCECVLNLRKCQYFPHLLSHLLQHTSSSFYQPP